MRTRRSNKPATLEQSPYLLEAAQVAYYHCVLGMPLKNIAELLSKSPATITRRLDEVRQAGWLRDRPEFTPPEEIWVDLKNRMTCSNAETALQEHFGPELLGRITVLPSAPGSTSRTSITESAERVGLYGATRLNAALCEGAHTVGINWGWSVRQCVMNLRPDRSNPDLRFFPLVGNLSLDESDPHFEEAIDCSSNRLAQAAAQAFGAPRSPRLSTPAYIPRRFYKDPAGLQTIRDFIESDISYRRIFGTADEPGAVESMDTLITGMSSLDVQTLPIYRPGLINESDISLLQKAGVVGDIGLHLVSEPMAENYSPDEVGSELIALINQLIIGASPREFLNIAERKRKGETDGLGVFVLAVGAWKAKILTTAIKMGAVNELITDMDTAAAIAKLEGLQIKS